MELRDLKTFVAVAGLLSFNRAGEALHAAQSTVSARIAAIEADLGVKLFERLGRRVALTEAGERLKDYARKILDLEDEARAWVSGEAEARGALTVRVPESLCACRMGGVIRRFRERFPNVRLSFTACTLEGLEKDLRQGVTDLAFLMADSIRAGDLVVELLGVERLLLVSAPGHRLAALGQVGAEDLRGETLVLSTADCSYRRMFEGLLSEKGVETAAGVAFSSAAALRGCIMDGVGVSLLPELAVRADLEAGRLAALDWRGGELETAVLMIRHKDKWLSPPLAAFMDMVRETLMQGAPAPTKPLLERLFNPEASPGGEGRCC
ncbi:HTH-type transcriptional regulator GltR [Fundidesulfovibrio magnetotacticus]|uniref:HTH-type transcriptional regulator GltR n=1 Tax=Fundidesulfovibrio magnetotacticus TaxID=2730080 RepID=A0A6V8LXL2_9BACT|nr:LysR family transcriptional regulator [Fundidesulfovibrio magnetotacticus]GFK95321.1 HTH-type transcriptional regulator GltR [Fundidesulfovibrio magnetotacticus]